MHAQYSWKILCDPIYARTCVSGAFEMGFQECPALVCGKSKYVHAAIVQMQLCNVNFMRRFLDALYAAKYSIGDPRWDSSMELGIELGFQHNFF